LYKGGQVVGTLHSAAIGFAASGACAVNWAVRAGKAYELAGTAWGMIEAGKKFINGEETTIWDYLAFAPAAGGLLGRWRGPKCFTADMQFAVDVNDTSLAGLTATSAGETGQGSDIGWLLLGLGVTALGIWESRRLLRLIKEERDRKQHQQATKLFGNLKDVDDLLLEPNMSIADEKHIIEHQALNDACGSLLLETDTAIDFSMNSLNDTITVPKENTTMRKDYSQSGISRYMRLAMIFLAFTVGGFCLFQAGDGRLFNERAVAAIEDKPAESKYVMKSVADFQAGDTILAFNHATGKHEKSVVVQAFSRTSDHLRILTFLNQAGEQQEIKTTNELPFWSVVKQDYITAAELTTGESFRAPDGSILWLAKSIYEPHPEGIAVYNLEVKGHHNYFVKAQGSRAPPVLAHNSSNCIETATELARRLGREGEAAAEIVKNTRRIKSLSGTKAYRIPDELTETTLTEVKNVKYQYFSTQLQDSLHYSIETGRQMTLKVRDSTGLSQPLLDAIDAGWITLEFLP